MNHCRIPIVSVLYVLFLLSSSTSASDEVVEEKSLLQQLLDEGVDRFQVYPSPQSQTALKSEVVMRWGNQERGNKDEGYGRTVIWTHLGRPEAIAAVYTWAGELKHEFSTLSRGLDLRAESELIGGSWQPAKQYLKFDPVPEAMKPSASSRIRLLQMKKLARDFSATLTGWRGDNSDRQELRMLPTPLKTYEVRDPESKVKGGAIFAFVQGTDPECVLVLESVQHEGGLRWEYALIRRTSGGLAARWKSKVVWQAPKHPRRTPQSANYTIGSPLELLRNKP